MTRGPGARIRARAPAKINATLRVLDRRADGYHDLRTVFQALALHDTLWVERTRGPFEIECDDPACPTDRSNLVWQAAQALWEARGRPGDVHGVRVRLVKRIPARAGLGGGSSDAAAALRALTVLWRVPLPASRLQGIAASLGADVPFFVFGGTALGVGRGDLVFPLADLPLSWVTLALPAFGIGTRDAYAWLDEDRKAGQRRPDPRAPRAAEWAPLRDWGWPVVELRNDLQPAVSARHPAIGRLVDRLWQRGAVMAAMSGSGSAAFGVFPTEGAARAAAAGLSGRACRTIVTTTLTRRRYETMAAARDLPGRRGIG